MGEQQTMAGDRNRSLSMRTIGGRWGSQVSSERQEALQSYLDRWNGEADHAGRKGPFEGVRLTGADVFWLATQVLMSDEQATLTGHVETVAKAQEFLRTTKNADGSIHVEVVSLSGLHLEGARLQQADLGMANLASAHLEGAILNDARLEQAFLLDAHLGGAQLSRANLGGAILIGGHFERALLDGAELTNANLQQAHLEGASLFRADLKGTHLRGAWFSNTTLLGGIRLDDRTELGDIKWGGVGAVDLTAITWERVATLGDEQLLRRRNQNADYAAVGRAYRQLAAQLRAQGMNEVADRFLYRAQIRQRWAHLSSLVHDWRRPWRWPGDIARYLGSLFLAVLAGYGYRPGRTLFWYVMTVLGFMGGFWLVTHGVPLFGLTEPSGTQPLHWYEALVLSVASFHGRGFFPQGISLGDPVAILAASEAVIGLFIEISFIATFTQRYFGGK